jgi:hypothetical protein
MVVCPVAIAVGCARCPAFKVCPAKKLLGNWRPDADATQPLPPAGRAAGRKSRAKARKR